MAQFSSDIDAGGSELLFADSDADGATGQSWSFVDTGECSVELSGQPDGNSGAATGPNDELRQGGLARSGAQSTESAIQPGTVECSRCGAVGSRSGSGYREFGKQLCQD